MSKLVDTILLFNQFFRATSVETGNGQMCCFLLMASPSRIMCCFDPIYKSVRASFKPSAKFSCCNQRMRIANRTHFQVHLCQIL
ncbi:unnamed protein product [Moneuplotes crassus]|uniref:Uncharacterized protein n=1 Tax=Euplotes crassus TaxID=5936 RepID=A0AAD1X1E3_EUPCR|nr:unnamed protein product [Moneuplotes crassus]